MKEVKHPFNSDIALVKEIYDGRFEKQIQFDKYGLLPIEYQIAGSESYIMHHDHEYIFYSLEEYEQRLKDNLQKGNAATRVKSFKIDHSKIPFTYEVEV